MADLPSHSSARRTIAVLGAGVTGLQTALSLLTSSTASPPSALSPRVIIIAQHFPDDSSIEYTSPWAGGHWRSHAHSSPEEADIRDWDARTYEEWRRLLAAPSSSSSQVQHGDATMVERQLGLGVRESVMLWSEETDETRGGTTGSGEGLWWRSTVTGFRVLSAKELLHARPTEVVVPHNESQSSTPPAVIFGARYDSVCINVPRYLAYLHERVAALGGRFIHATVRTDSGVEGVVRDVQRVVRAAAVPDKKDTIVVDVDALVLATGLLSRLYLPPDEAAKLYPVRGQTVLVRGEAPRAVTHLLPGGDIAYVIPRPGSGTTVLGGSKDVGDWNADEDLALTRTILERARALVPELLSRRGEPAVEGAESERGEFDVLSVQVGRRPGRKGGPRVESEKVRVEGVRIIYAYGHEGAGYQNSVGSAEKVVKLLARD